MIDRRTVLAAALGLAIPTGALAQEKNFIPPMLPFGTQYTLPDQAVDGLAFENGTITIRQDGFFTTETPVANTSELARSVFINYRLFTNEGALVTVVSVRPETVGPFETVTLRGGNWEPIIGHEYPMLTDGVVRRVISVR